ncbi:glycosyltransferase [Candidatus Daviesbacteria bacterium]|nr:glycosyltransferase [Candidatus Daviesbacteria bacterium]
MKIAYFTDTFLPQLNGIATALANQAKELGKQGHEILIFTPKLDDIKRTKFVAKNVTVVHLPTVPALIYTEYKFGVFGLPRIIKHLIKFKPDILHSHTPFTIGLDAVLAAKVLKKPLVGTAHIYFTDSDYLRFVKYDLAVKLLGKISERYLNFMFNQCDLVLAPSKALTSDLKNNGFKKPILYLPNGVILKTPKFLTEEEKKSLKSKYGLKDKVVLHFGRLSYEKNIDLLIKAFYLLTKNNKNLSLLIIGDGPAKKSLGKLSKKLGIEKQVLFTGFIDHQILISSGMLGVGDVFATASTMENNPMVVLETMVYGLPVVGVKQAGLIELVSANGFLVEPGNYKQLAEKIDKILSNKDLAKKMSQQSLRLIRNYSIEKSVNKLIRMYQTLISKAGRI